MTCQTWTCVFLPGVTEYIHEMRDILYDLQARVQKAKLNMDRITQLMEVAFAGALRVPSREVSCGIYPSQQSGAALSSSPCRSAQPLPCLKGRTTRTPRSWTWTGKQTP